MTGSGSLLLRNGHVVDPVDGFDGPAALLIRDGRIQARVAPGEKPPEVDQTFDVTGCVVCPGFVDLHAHLRFPGFAHKETIASGTAAAAAGGFTTVCAMANTDPPVDRVELLEQVQTQAKREAVVRVRQLAAVSLGLRGERLTDFAALAAAGAPAFSDDGKPVWSETVMQEALAQSRILGKAISVHEEDPAIVGRGVANAGPTARRLGLPEWPCSGEAAMVERDLRLLEESGGRLHIAHVSCADTVEILRQARAKNLPVTAEATPHHLCLSDVLLGGDDDLGLPAGHPYTKVNPPLRSILDAATLVEALADGTIDAIATDHAPHSAADKNQDYQSAAFGFTASETALPLLLSLVRAGRISLPLLIRRLTLGPAHVFGLEGGTLLPGQPADICVFDPDRRWRVTAEALRSQGKNTPLLGAEMTGRVVCTIVGGHIVHRLEE